MVRLRLDSETLGLSTILERIARVKVKDCFKWDDNDTVYFIVEFGHLGKAVGKNAVNVKRIQQELNKKVRIIEYNPDVIRFVKNVIYPFKVETVIEEDGEIVIKDQSRKTKSLLIGRDSKNLKLINRAVKRFFSIKEVKVV
jgi:NusA-like KH domain protein